MTLLAGWIFLGEVPNIRVTTGAFLATLGVFAIVILQYWLGGAGALTPNPGMKTGPLFIFLSSIPRSGEICIFLAVVSSTASTIIGFHALRRLPHYLFSILKMLLGLVLFFFIVISMFGWHHFADLFPIFMGVDALLWECYYCFAILFQYAGHETCKSCRGCNQFINNSSDVYYFFLFDIR